MTTLARAGTVLTLAAALGACTTPPAALSPTPAGLRSEAVTAHHASAPKAVWVALGIAAAAVVILLVANNSGGTGY